jgi:transposase
VKNVYVEDLEDLIRQEKNKRFAKRLIFIRAVYDGEPAQKAAKKLGRSSATGYFWLKRWNNQTTQRLKPPFRGGRPTKLSSNEKELRAPENLSKTSLARTTPLIA